MIRRESLCHSCIELLVGVAQDVDRNRTAHGGEDSSKIAYLIINMHKLLET